MSKKGLKIIEVEAGSIAEAIKLAPGDRILSINGHEIPDELALQFRLSEEFVEIVVHRVDGTEVRFAADLSEQASLGVRVEDFRTRTCNNKCLFCFVDQLPSTVRSSLRLKDDDYRLSFLHGNYITLTNLHEQDLDRIIEQRMTPLYVSVHATDPALRARMLGRSKVDDLCQKLGKLIQGGIQIHGQIVLMPGINDGLHLQKTVFDLFALYPGVQSVAIVPLGLSDHGTIKDRYTPVTPASSRRVIRQAEPWQAEFHRQAEKTFVYLADEFYLRAGARLPKAEYYDDFAQLEDGVGMVRNFLDAFDSALRARRRRLARLNGTLATGSLFFGILCDCAERFNTKFGSSLRVRQVKNRFMGKQITVAGLLAGRDFLTALSGCSLGEFLIIPQESVSRVNGVFIDDLSPADLAKRFGIPVYPGGRTVYELFNLLFKIGRQLHGKYGL